VSAVSAAVVLVALRHQQDVYVALEDLPSVALVLEAAATVPGVAFVDLVEAYQPSAVTVRSGLRPTFESFQSSIGWSLGYFPDFYDHFQASLGWHRSSHLNLTLYI
jgi:hypothetical protein